MKTRYTIVILGIIISISVIFGATFKMPSDGSSPNDISHAHHALRIGIDPDHFTLSELEYQGKKIREYLGDEMNIIYKKSGYITYDQ